MPHRGRVRQPSIARLGRALPASLRPRPARLPLGPRARVAAVLGLAVGLALLWWAGPRPLPVVAYDPARPLTVDTDLRSRSGLTAATIDAYLASRTELPPLGDAFLAAERDYGVNARYLVAHAVLESGRGTSYIARTFHNLFGWNAVDADPVGAASRFADDASGIDFVARQISELYLTPGGRWWGGAPTLRAMNQRYASDPGWSAKIARLANELPVVAGGVPVRAGVVGAARG